MAGCYPKGVCYCPHVKRRPFQARVWWGRRYWSLGYFASITEAEMAAAKVREEVRQWKDVQLPPPTLLPALRKAEARGAMPLDQSPQASGTADPDPLPSVPRSGTPATP